MAAARPTAAQARGGVGCESAAGFKEKPAAGITRRALLFNRSGRFLPETPEAANRLTGGRNASLTGLSIRRGCPGHAGAYL